MFIPKEHFHKQIKFSSVLSSQFFSRNFARILLQGLCCWCYVFQFHCFGLKNERFFYNAMDAHLNRNPVCVHISPERSLLPKPISILNYILISRNETCQ